MRSSSFCTTGGTEQTKVKPDRSDRSDKSDDNPQAYAALCAAQAVDKIKHIDPQKLVRRKPKE